MNRILHRLTYFLIIVFALSFTFFLIIAAYFVRPCSDDLWFYYEFNQKGWFNSIYEFNFNKRWVSYLTYNTICLFSKNFVELHKAYFVFYLFEFSLLLLSTTRLIKISIEHFLKTKINYSRSFLLAALFLSSLYFTTLYGQEVWFWTVANTTYLLPIPLVFIGIYEFINKSSNLSKVLIACVFFLIGGMVENLIIAIILSLFLHLFYNFKNKNSDQIIKSIIALISISILPFISFCGNGINNRINLVNSSCENHVIRYFDTVFYDYELKINPFRIAIFISVLCMIFFIAKGMNQKLKNTSFNFKKLIKMNVLLFVLVSISTYAPLINVFGNLGPARASMPFVLMICLSCCVWVFIIGVYMGNEKKYIYFISTTFGTLLILMFINKQYNMSKTYTNAYDCRVKYINTQKENKCKYIVVNPLPDSGVLASQEVSRINLKRSMTSYYLGRVNGINKDVYLK